MKNWFKSLATTAGTFALVTLLAGCTGSSPVAPNPSTPLAIEPAVPAQAAGTTLVQSERLGRPAINEGLLITNDFLNAYNSIPPSSDVTALTTTPVGTEAIATLTALGNNAAQTNAIVAAFIPDVMRIDTTIVSTYAGGVTFTGAPFTSDIATIPTGGRLLADDVIDITLAVLTHAAITTDNVSYQGGGNVGQGHSPLSTTFPYMAPAY